MNKYCIDLIKSDITQIEEQKINFFPKFSNLDIGLGFESHYPKIIILTEDSS